VRNALVQYDSHFITNAVELVKASDRTFREIAQDLGVPSSTLQYWYKARVPSKKAKKRRAGEVPAVIKREETTAQRIARLERENAALRHQVSSLETDRAILKKAAAFFAKESE
jgi:transposase